jgi:hypothetical protein
MDGEADARRDSMLNATAMADETWLVAPWKQIALLG